MKGLTRIISLLLVLIMMTGIVSVGVSAEGVTPDYSTALKFGTDHTKYSDGVPITVDGVDYAGQDFRSWLQYDDRWGSVRLGSSETIGHVGCLVTAITKLIIEAGLASPAELNPDMLVKYLNDNSGFDGNALIWSKVSEFCRNVLGKDFTLVDACYRGKYDADKTPANRDSLTLGSNVTNAQMIGWLNQGYHMLLQVNKNAGHWIAVDEWETLSRNDGHVYIMDSWRNTEPRHAITLEDYLAADFGSLYSYPADAIRFSRIAVFSTDLSDTDNANFKEYDTDFIGYQDYNYTYRNWSRYDSRWAATVLDEPQTGTAEYVGEWGQALLALTKTLIESGAVSEDTTPNDVLALLKSKSLIGAADGIIRWGALDALDNVSSSAAGSSTTTISAATIRSNIRLGKHHILRAKETGTDDMAWLAVDEPRIMASASADIPVLDSGKSLIDNAGRQTISGSLHRLHTFNTSTTPAYKKLTYSGTNASALTASYTLGSDTITVDNGGYVPAGTEVTLTAVPDTGYSGVDWSAVGSTGTPGGTSYTVTVSDDTAVTAAGVAGTYDISYTTQTDTCGFRYGTVPSTATYGSTVTFTVDSATSCYDLEASCDDVELTLVSKTANPDETDANVIRSYTYTYQFTMPAKNIRIHVAATFSTYTIYLDAGAVEQGNEKWYAYTWTGVTGDEYDEQWIEAEAQKTANGYYQFNNVRDRVVFVRTDKTKTVDTTKNLRDVIHDENTAFWNQSADYNVQSEALYTITGYTNGTLDVNAEYSSVYLYARPFSVRKGYDYTQHGILNEYNAWTWNNNSDGEWAKKTVDEYGIIRFYGVKNNIIFVRNNPQGEATFDGTNFWNRTADLNLNDTSNPIDGNMFVINKEVSGKMTGYWADYADITGSDYKQWTKNDPRWSKVTLGGSTVADDLIGNYQQVQAFTKLVMQAGLHPEWDIADMGANTTYVPNGNVADSTAAVYKAWGFTNQSVRDTATYTVNATLAATIYGYLIRGQHIIIRGYGSSGNGEWVAVDEERTLATYIKNKTTNITDIYVLRTTDNPDECEGMKLSDVDTKVCRIIAYEGGTTPLLTRNYDYRRWSRYDGRWRDDSVGKSHTMLNNGACVIAVAKMFVQAGVLKDDYDGDGIYDADFSRSALTGDFTPKDLRDYLVSVNGFVLSDDPYTDGALSWPKVNDFVQHTLEFATVASKNGVIYLVFDQDDQAVIGTAGFPRKVESGLFPASNTNAYVCEDEEATIMKALLQGYHMLIEVPSKSVNNVTWVAVDEAKSLETGRIYVMDSEESVAFNADITLVDDYQYFYRIVGYKGATVPLPTEYTTPDGETLISPHLEPSVYYDTETAADGKSDCYRILYNSGSYLTVQVGGAVVGKSYVMTVDGQEYEVPATAENTANGILTFTFDGTAENVANKTPIPLNDDVTNTQLKKELSVKCKYEKDGTVTYSNTVTGTMYYKMYAVYEFKYRPRRGGDEVTSTIRVPCEYRFLDGNAPKADAEIIATHIPSGDDVNIYKEIIDWSKAGISTQKYITTVNAKEPKAPGDPAQYPERFTLTYYYYDESGSLTLSGTYSDVAYNTQTVDLRHTDVLNHKPAGASDDDVFIGWYEASMDGEELVIGDRCLSTLEHFGMVITRNTMIAPKFGAKATGSDWAAYIDENTVTVEKSDDANGGHMYADFLVRYLNAGGTDVAVPDNATYGVLFVYSSDDLANTSAKNASTLKAYATHSALLSGTVGNTNDGNGHSMKVVNAKAEALSELNRVSIAVQNSYNNFRGCHYTAYAYITYTDSQTGAKVTSLSSSVTGRFPS